MDNALYEIYSYMIRQSYPNAKNIRLPGVVGAQNNVLIAEVNGTNRVFKFSIPDLVKKNQMVSQEYNRHGIPVPKISATQMDFLFCEEYDLIPGTSLFEAIRAGIGGDEIRTIYQDVLSAFAKMRRVGRPSEPDGGKLIHAHNFARYHVANGQRTTLAELFGAATYLMNLGKPSDIGLYHYDITPKNIILNPDGKFSGLVDLDSVGICNKNFAFGVMASKYQEIGLDCRELMDYYIDTTSDSLARNRILGTAKINAMAKKMLWQRANAHKRQK